MSFQIGNAQLGVTFTGDPGSLQRALDQAGGSVDRWGNKTRSEMRGVASEAGGALTAMDRLANGIKGAFLGGSVAVGLITLKNTVMSATSAVIDAQVQLDRWRNGFSFGAGGMAAGAQEFAFVREEVARLGLDLGSTAAQYMKMVAASRGSALAGAQTREVFKSIAEASVVMGMNADQNERAFMAVTQMMSKGKVMAEELRGQLSEHLPGSFAIAARAMGVTEVELNKLMETGQVFSADFLPKFAAQLRKELAGSVEQSSLSMQANLNRLGTAWLNLKQQFSQSGAGDALSSGIKVAAGDLQALGDVMEASRQRGDGFWKTMANTAGAAAGRATFGALSGTFNTFNATVNALTGNVFGLNESLNLMPDNLRSTAEQFELGNQKIRQAESEYAALSARLAQAPDNIYIKSELGNLARYISALRLARDEQQKMMGGAAGSGAIGSVASGDVALARAQRAEYEKELAARAALRKKYATPAEKMAEELASQKALLGSLWSTEEEKRIRESFGKGGGGGGRSAVKKDDFGDLLGRLTSQDVGLDPSFYKDLDTLYQGYQKGRIGADAYRGAVEMLVGSQRFAKDAADKEAEANKAAAKALEDVVSAAEKAARTARDNAQAMEREVELIGMSEGQLHDLEQARLADAAASLRRRAAIMADIDLSGRAAEALRAEADELDALAAAKGRGYLRRAEVAGEESVAQTRAAFMEETRRRSETLADSITDGIMEGARNGASTMEIFRNELRARFSRTILRPIIQPVADGFDSVIQSGLSSLASLFMPSMGPSMVDPSASFASDFAQYLVPSAKGNVFSGPGISAYSSQVVDCPTVFPFAKGAGLMGEAGAEGILPLRRDSSGRLGVTAAGMGGGNVTVQVINQTGQQVGVASQRETTGADGSKFLEIVLVAVGDSLANRSGPPARGLESGYGVRPAMA